jgi:DNA-binding NarL/FixJ family response regulator
MDTFATDIQYTIGGPEMITVAIADDQTNVRRGVRAMLEAEPDLTIVGEAVSGLEAIGLVHEVRPEVLVLDLLLGDISGFEVTTRLRERCPATKVVIFSVRWDGHYVMRAQQVGAKGYVPKKTPEELVTAIRAIWAGGQYFPRHDDPPHRASARL